MIKVGYAVGKCGNCGKELTRLRPADVAVCDCYEYCPQDGALMEPYTPDLTPSTYRPEEGGEHPMEILFRCPVCGYLSAQQPVEVRLS
jgi:NAD-dependent dihydropyrimidine dehydrogenase PreA subunit